MPRRLSQLIAALLCAIAFSRSMHAAEGVIVSLDQTKGEMTIAEGQQLETLRFRPGSEVTLNGRKATTRDLAVGQRVVTASGDPGVATKINATGLAIPGGEKGKPLPNVKPDIRGTRWHVSNITGPPPDRHWVEFKADGSTEAGWHKRNGSWKLLADGRIEAEFSPKAGRRFIINLESDGRSGSYRHENGVTVIRRLPK